MPDSSTLPTRSYTWDENRKIPKLKISGIHKAELPRFSARTTSEHASLKDAWWKQQTCKSARDRTTDEREGIKEGTIYTTRYLKYHYGPYMQPQTMTPQRRRAIADHQLANAKMMVHSAGMNSDGSNSGFNPLPISISLPQSASPRQHAKIVDQSWKDILRGGTDGRKIFRDPFRANREPVATKIIQGSSPGMDHAGCCDYGLIRWTDTFIRQHRQVSMWRDGTTANTWSGPPVDAPKEVTHPNFKESHFDRAARRPVDRAEQYRRQRIAAFIDAQDAIQRRKIPKTPGVCPSPRTMAASLDSETRVSFSPASQNTSRETAFSSSLLSTALHQKDVGAKVYLWWLCSTNFLRHKSQ